MILFCRPRADMSRQDIKPASAEHQYESTIANVGDTQLCHPLEVRDEAVQISGAMR